MIIYPTALSARQRPPAGSRIFRQTTSGGLWLPGVHGGVTNATGNSPPAKVIGGVSYVRGPFGAPALKFDNATGYVDCGLNGNTAFNWGTPNAFLYRPRTFWAWVRRPSSSSVGPIFAKGSNSTNSGWSLSVTTTGLTAGWVGSNNGHNSTPNVLSVGDWHHVAIAWSGGSDGGSDAAANAYIGGMSIYLDGVWQGAPSTGLWEFNGQQNSLDSFNLWIGQAQYVGGSGGAISQWADLEIDHWGLDYRVYSPDEVADLYRRPFKFFAPSPTFLRLMAGSTTTNATSTTSQGQSTSGSLSTGIDTTVSTSQGQTVATSSSITVGTGVSTSQGQTITAVAESSDLTDEEFQAWLENPLSIPVLLVETYANISGVETEMKFASGAFHDASYLPIMSVGIEYTEQLSLNGSSSLSFGDLKLENPNSEIDDYLNYVWVNRSVVQKLGDIRWPLSYFKTVFKGYILDIDSEAAEVLNLKLIDTFQQLNSPISDVKLGGSTTNKNVVIPSAFGEVHNITPILTDEATGEYQYHGSGANGVGEARTDAKPREITDSPSTGKFTFDTAVGPGVVTCSVQGSGTGGTSIGWVSAQRWRVKITSIVLNEFQNMYVDEFQFRETPGVPQLFSGGTIVATGLVPANAAGGAGNWASNGAFHVASPDTWEYQYPTQKAIAEYTIMVYASVNSTRPTAWDFQYWDGAAWITADSRSGITWSDVGPRTFSVAQVITTLPGTYVNTVSGIIQRIVTGYGKDVDRLTTADLDLTNLNAFDAANPQVVGYYSTGRENVITVCQFLAASLGAQLIPSREGKLRLIKIEIPPPSEDYRVITRAMMFQKEGDLHLVERTKVQPTWLLGFCKNWTVQPTLSTSIPLEHKEMFAKEWLQVKSEDIGVRITYKLSAEPVQKDTALQIESEAQTEADRLRDLWKTAHGIYEFTGTAELLNATIGEFVTVVHPRYGMSAGVPGMIVKLKPTFLKREVLVGVLI